MGSLQTNLNYVQAAIWSVALFCAIVKVRISFLSEVFITDPRLYTGFLLGGIYHESSEGGRGEDVIDSLYV